MKKTILVPRGQNIGRTVINSFLDYTKVHVRAIDVARDTVNKQNVVELTYTAF